MKRSKVDGFSLIELMVTVAIIAMLATIGFVSYRSANQRSRNARRSSDLQQVRSALEMYRTEKGAYPPCDCTVSSACPGTAITSWLGAAGLEQHLKTDYMSVLPSDPQVGSTSVDYVYSTDVIAKCPAYEMCSPWEGGSPPTACSSPNTWLGVVNP